MNLCRFDPAEDGLVAIPFEVDDLGRDEHSTVGVTPGELRIQLDVEIPNAQRADVDDQVIHVSDGSTERIAHVPAT
jgi:hypothetical protein